MRDTSLRNHFEDKLIEAQFSILYVKQGVYSDMHEHLQIMDEIYEEEILVRVRGNSEVLGKLRAHLRRK